VINGKHLLTLPSTKNLIAPKAKLLFSKQWAQVKAKEKELHIVQSIDYTGSQKAQKFESNDASNKYYLTSCKALNQEYKAI
jgi:hypothetical protein